MNPIEEYKLARNIQVSKNIHDNKLNTSYSRFLQQIHRTNYVKNFTWMGQPILQFPSDMFVMQELIWEIQPDVLIETGMAFGGSALFYASVMDKIGGIVITVDKEVRPHNRKAIEEHPIQYDMDGSTGALMIAEGNSIAQETLKEVVTIIKQRAANFPPRVIVCLDSNHTHDHVLREMELYGPLVSVGSYMVVFDTAIQLVMAEQPTDRPWGPGNNPWTAVREFMKTHDEFVVDREVEQRALLTAAPGGWLRRIK